MRKKLPVLKGQWRKKAFQESLETLPLDLEIGIGKGGHFANYAKTHSQRLFLGVELKYKPLIQSIKRVLSSGQQNARVFRYNACFLDEVFARKEINDVMIYFPDPWPKKRHWKHRLLQLEFLERLYPLQKQNSRLFFKTDCLSYFHWALENFKKSSYTVTKVDFDMKPQSPSYFTTEFEKIFRTQNIPIKYLEALRI